MILVLGGTTDARNFIAELREDYIVTVATEYGYNRFKNLYGSRIILIRFTESSLTQFIKERQITLVADCTHPFAQEITALAKSVCILTGIHYESHKREVGKEYGSYDRLHYMQSWGAAMDYFDKTGLSLLFFTIGSKNLYRFQRFLGDAIVRVLDDPFSVEICHSLGISDDRIIARRGPFTVEDTLDVIRKFGIKCTVTKDSGIAGGVSEKIEAAAISGTDIVVVQRN